VTAPAVAATLPLGEIVQQREGLQAELAQLEREAAALPAQINAAIDAGDTATALKLERRRVPHVKERIAALSAQLAEVLEQERVTSKRDFERRRREALERAEGRQRATFWAAVKADEAAAALWGEHRKETERVGQLRVDLTGNPDLLGQEIKTRGGAGFVLAFAERIAAWLDAQPGVDLQLDIIDRITGPLGEAARRARDSFFKR